MPRHLAGALLRALLEDEDLAVAALRDSRLPARAKLEKLRDEIGFTDKAIAPFEDACADNDKLACFLAAFDEITDVQVGGFRRPLKRR